MKTGRTRALLQLGGALTVALSLVVAAASPASAQVTLSPSSGPPGSKVTASGSSTSPTASCKTVDVYFGATKHSDGHVVSRGTKVASGNCDTAGRYSVPFSVPTNAAKGATQVLVAGKDAAGGSVSEETANFTVT